MEGCMRALRNALRIRATLLLSLCFCLLISCARFYAQSNPRITQNIDVTVTARIPHTSLTGIKDAIDLGRLDGSTSMGSMLLVLNSSPAQEQALELLIDQQHDRISASYHRWLSPEEFGRYFGLAKEDLRKITDWLQSYGFSILDVAPGGRTVLFTGSVDQVESAFHTEMRSEGWRV